MSAPTNAQVPMNSQAVRFLRSVSLRAVNANGSAASGGCSQRRLAASDSIESRPPVAAKETPHQISA